MDFLSKSEINPEISFEKNWKKGKDSVEWQ